MKPKIKRLLYGIASFIPGITYLYQPATGGTNSARYCYFVWLRQLVLAHKHKLCATVPTTVAEFGPGDSIGTGLAALLSGVETYYGLDVVNYTQHERNLAIFDELVNLFSCRAPIPNPQEFPEALPYLDSYDFPSDLLTDRHLEQALDEHRLSMLQQSLLTKNDRVGPIQYAVPWYRASNIPPDSIDMIFSQAVMEHVDDLSMAYRVMASYLKPSGFMSHQIDFRCHGTADEWNGHWKYADWQWTLMRGKRSYLINREPYSVHLRKMEEAGLRMVWAKTIEESSQLEQQELAPRFRSMSDSDLNTRGAFIQAVRR